MGGRRRKDNDFNDPRDGSRVNRCGIPILKDTRRLDDDRITRGFGKTDVLARTRGRCFYCGLRIDPYSMTIDHYVPSALGGTDLFFNLVPACAKCNQAKGPMTVLQFRPVFAELNGLQHTADAPVQFYGERAGVII